MMSSKMLVSLVAMTLLTLPAMADTTSTTTTDTIRAPSGDMSGSSFAADTNSETSHSKTVHTTKHHTTTTTPATGMDNGETMPPSGDPSRQ